MKSRFFWLIIPLAVLVACNGREKELEAQNAELMAVNGAKDLEISKFLGALNSIQDNLDSIKATEDIITAMAVEDVENPIKREERIVEDILLIYDKMQENKRMLEKLDKQLEGSSINNSELARTVNLLKKRIKQKDEEIAVLKDELAKADIVIDNLMEDLDQMAVENSRKLEVIREKQEVLKEKEAEIQRGYYIIGTSKELEEKNIITKEGGFLGMGRIPKVSEKAQLELFTEINILDKTTFDLGGRKTTLVSSHPDVSYEFYGEKTIDSLVVEDPEAFWQNTKVMVILVR